MNLAQVPSPGRRRDDRAGCFGRHTVFSALSAALVCGCALLSGSGRASAQAAPTAIGPGSYVSIGLEGSAFQQDYGHHFLGGEGLFSDANLFRRIGIETEIRQLNFRTVEDVKETTYLGGIKISTNPKRFRPYVKLLAGRGKLDFPFHYAIGSYFVVAPGAGLDFHLRNSRFSIRAVDAEYQIWPKFTYGELHPYGISTGISFDLFSPGGSPRGLRFR